jgi:AcrR family transcriptional regulator
LRTSNGTTYDRAHETDGQGAAPAMPAPREMNVAPMPGRRPRRPRGSLTREAVVDAALALVDAEGIDALSMPRLARQVDAGVMTLYHYVRSQSELLEAVALRAIAEVRLQDLHAHDAPAILLDWGRGLREVLLAPSRRRGSPGPPGRHRPRDLPRAGDPAETIATGGVGGSNEECALSTPC